MGNHIMSATELYWLCWECHESAYATRSWPLKHARLVHGMGFDYTTQRMV